MIKHERYPLARILYYRIGGTARYLLEASRQEDVLEAIYFVRENGIDRLVVVGLGSNLLFPDGPFDGAVLRIVSGGEGKLDLDTDGIAAAFAGETLDRVINFGFENGLAGLEWAGGLPGTVGAAVRGNVGAFGGELKDVLEWADVLDMCGPRPEVRRLRNDELAFTYRSSAVKLSRNLVVLSGAFRLRRTGEADLAAARETYQANIVYRETNHPMEYPTCGSTFKNLERREEVEKVLSVWPDVRELVEGRWHGKVSMGYIISRLGLRGYRLGDAQVSLKHNNFIVNLGEASFADVSGIIGKIQEACSSLLGFVPEPEVEIVGKDR